MKLSFSKKEITLNKELSFLDKFVINFCNLLEKDKIKYVVVSGYVSIVFGRSRNTEDIDILFQKLSFEKFTKLWNSIIKNYDCINATNSESAYSDYLAQGSAIRFVRKDEFIPNIEFKFVKTVVDKYTLKNAVKLNINKENVFISPFEVQIAYKLFLGSPKDIEDARFLYKLFSEHFDNKKFKYWIPKMNLSTLVVKKIGIEL